MVMAVVVVVNNIWTIRYSVMVVANSACPLT